MAVPESMTTSDFSGHYELNRQLSETTDLILELQGVAWVIRDMIQSADVTVYIKSGENETSHEAIIVDQRLNGVGDTIRIMLFDGISREYRDNLLGDVVTVRKRVKLDEITEEFLREGWTNDTIEEEKGIVQISISKDTNKTGSTWNAWTEYQTWGFEEIDGVRRYVRRVHFYSPVETAQARLVYDYKGPICTY